MQTGNCYALLDAIAVIWDSEFVVCHYCVYMCSIHLHALFTNFIYW
jgi:hypothetical protein